MLPTTAMDRVRVKVYSFFQVLMDTISMLDLLEDFMELRGTPYGRLDGSTSRPRRNLDIRLVGSICLTCFATK